MNASIFTLASHERAAQKAARKRRVNAAAVFQHRHSAAWAFRNLAQLVAQHRSDKSSAAH
jgi:hypothetical protein